MESMTSVASLLTSKGDEIWHTTRETSVLDAVKQMVERETGALMVVEDGKLVGIVSERDCVRKVLQREASPRAVTVGEIMTEKVLFVRPDQTIEDCMALMTERHVRHLPVLADD